MIREEGMIESELAFRIKALRAGLNDILARLQDPAFDKEQVKLFINKSLAFDAALAAAAGDERP